MKEKGLRHDDPFSEVVARASVIDLEHAKPFETVAEEAVQLFSQNDPKLFEASIDPFMESIENGVTLIGDRAALPNARLAGCTHTEMVIVRSRDGILVPSDVDGQQSEEKVHALFFVVSPLDEAGQHLRLLAELAHQVEQSGFLGDWLTADDWHELKEILLHQEQMLTLWLTRGHLTEPLIGMPLSEVDWPEHVLVALVHRDGEEIIPDGRLILQEEDQLIIIGMEEGIEMLYVRYVSSQQQKSLTA